MTPRFPSLRNPPIALASAGASDASVDDLLAVLASALAPGTYGIAGAAWLTADGHPVVHRDAVVRRGLRRQALSDLRLDEIPDDVVDLRRLLGGPGDAHVVLSIGDDATAEAVASTATAATAAVARGARVWLRTDDWRQAASWRALSDDIGLVASTRLRRLEHGPERHAALVANGGVDAVQLPEGDWTPGLTTLFHRFGRLAMAGPAPHRRQLVALVDMGVDAISSEHAERLVEARAAAAGSPTTDPGRSAATP